MPCNLKLFWKMKNVILKIYQKSKICYEIILKKKKDKVNK